MLSTDGYLEGSWSKKFFSDITKKVPKFLWNMIFMQLNTTFSKISMFPQTKIQVE